MVSYQKRISSISLDFLIKNKYNILNHKLKVRQQNEKNDRTAKWCNVITHSAVGTSLTIRNKVQSFNQLLHWTMNILEAGYIHCVGAVNDILAKTTVKVIL